MSCQRGLYALGWVIRTPVLITTSSSVLRVLQLCYCGKTACPACEALTG